jgi:ribosomal protein S18 acetylase RimI-like enzyme
MPEPAPRFSDGTGRLEMMDKLEIRPACPAEEATIVALWQACGLVASYNDPAEEFRLALGRPNSDILVAISEGRILGSLMVGHDGHRGWLYYVSTHPDARGLGIARRLIGDGEEWLRQRKMRKVQLLVRSTNAAVMAFYDKLGFKPVPSSLMQKYIVAP